MEERRRVRASNPASYGATRAAYGPGYPANQDMERAPLLSEAAYFPDGISASAAMAPAMTPAYHPAAPTHPAMAEGPTAPLAPPGWGSIPGYESIGDDGTAAKLRGRYSGTTHLIGSSAGKFLPPPDLGPIPGAVMGPAENNNWTIPFISEETARKALVDYAKSKCCYRTAPAEEMEFCELRPYNTYRYRLETFTESRTCEWVTKPYTGEAIVPAGLAPPPRPWDIPVQVPAMFKDDCKRLPVPHTSSVNPCAQCLGICRTVCKKCHGGGRVSCWVCNGTGRQFNDPCHRCRGCGTESCTDCHGTRYQKCSGCSGQGKILNYIELTVTWKNNIFEHIVDHNSDFPTDLFKKVNGERVFSDEQMLLPPLVTFPAPSINQASQNAVQQHRSQFSSSSRILRQRHSIEWLPLTKVDYVWRGKPYDYFVFGKENKVYADTYPQKCCCVVM